jgi:hypothetical protein
MDYTTGPRNDSKGNVHFHQIYLFLTSQMGLQTESTKRVHVNSASNEEKMQFKKEHAKY